MKRAIQRAIYRPVKRLFAAAGFDLLRRHFYSPIPNIAALPRTVWDRTDPLTGIDFDADAQMNFVENNLAEGIREFQSPITFSNGYTFRLANDSFGHGDAEVLFGMVRWARPRRIVELGSGHSSVVIRLAARANEADGHPLDYSAFDPFPTDHLAGTDLAHPPQPVAAQELQADLVGALERNDILFVDTTHTVKIGGEVNRIILELLPRLEPGVLVHFHDIFLPYEYSRSHAENECYWTEQYLLQAFLIFNECFEVLIGAHALARQQRQRLTALIPSVVEGSPASFWIRRID